MSAADREFCESRDAGEAEEKEAMTIDEFIQLATAEMLAEWAKAASVLEVAHAGDSSEREFARYGGPLKEGSVCSEPLPKVLDTDGAKAFGKALGADLVAFAQHVADAFKTSGLTNPRLVMAEEPRIAVAESLSVHGRAVWLIRACAEGIDPITKCRVVLRNEQLGV